MFSQILIINLFIWLCVTIGIVVAVNKTNDSMFLWAYVFPLIVTIVTVRFS
jgi:hypothetical protein